MTLGEGVAAGGERPGLGGGGVKLVGNGLTDGGGRVECGELPGSWWRMGVSLVDKVLVLLEKGLDLL